jgi:TetR/AcrR family transcriptional regulator, cholesterol catabolism regulator
MVEIREFVSRRCIFVPAMSPTTALDSKQEILRVAARLFQQRGYHATSMNDVAAALRLSKGGLYHHFQSKDEILFDLMTHALDITEQRVIDPVRSIADPEERLRTLIRLHVDVVLSVRDREITVLLHENHPLPPSLRKQINARKKDYVRFVEKVIAEVQHARRASGVVGARAATFALLGMINWIYQWYKPEGPLNAEQIARQYTEIFFAGALQ